jgi:hypothetical protein
MKPFDEGERTALRTDIEMEEVLTEKECLLEQLE